MTKNAKHGMANLAERLSVRLRTKWLWDPVAVT